MRDREDSEKRDEEAKETDTRTESTSMEETERRDTDTGTRETDGRTDPSHETDPRSSAEKRGRDTYLGTSETDYRTDLRHERDPRSSAEKKENATGMRDELGQSSEYPVRVGVEDCQYYLRNGHCGYGRSCRFNHPPLVQPIPYPERNQMRHGMVQPIPYPVSLGARDCRQYLKNGKCSYGSNCRFNHPPDHLAQVLPQRVSRQICRYFQKGNCTHGSGCKFTHSMRGDGAETMPQDTTWGKKFHEKRHGEESSSWPEKRERHADEMEEQKHKKRKVETLRIDQANPTVQTGEGGSQTEKRVEIPENRSNVSAQVNLQEQANMERQKREGQEKAEEERRQQIENARREARLRLDQMNPRVHKDNVDEVRESLKDIGIEWKEGDGV